MPLRAIVFCLALGFAVAPFTTVCSAATKDWVGDGSALWSHANNWDPPGFPQNGDILRFGFLTNPPIGQIRDMANDILRLQVRAIEFTGFGWSLVGNELTLLGGVDQRPHNNLYSGSSMIINCPIKLGDFAGFDITYGWIIVNGNVNLNGNELGLDSSDEITVSGQITGTGNVVAVVDGYYGSHSITFNGPMGNTFTGKLTIRQKYEDIGQVVFDKQSGVVVNDGLLIERDEASLIHNRAVCKLARSHQIGDNAVVGIAGGGQFLLQGHTETIGSLSLTNYSGDTEPSLVDTGGATLSVLGDIVALNNATNANVRPTIRGILGLPGGTEAMRAAAMSSEDAAAIVARAPLPTSLTLQSFDFPVK
jgi:hypothetical protein